jgi:maltooligosyltrehalose trehalohydrolase
MAVANQTISETSKKNKKLGATWHRGGLCSFRVWAPYAQRVELRLDDELHPMSCEAGGYFFAEVDGVEPGARYKFILDNSLERPDPASRFQPEGVHGPSEVVPADFAWTDQAWFGVPLREHIFYEVHVGTFTKEGTFEAMIPRLSGLKELGITALELMPVGQFPGSRNWGYDGVYPFAVQNSYGGPLGLKKLVNAAHGAGIAVILDVVYNHFGPEGNYLRDFGPYFTERHRTPWGEAFNFDGEYSDEVRRFFIENALQWQTEFHFDGLRLDAVHAIHDESATPFLVDLARATRRRACQVNRRFHLIAESDLNDVRLVLPETVGGHGIDAHWADDFHHCLHFLLTGERDGYYADYTEGIRQFARTLENGYAYIGNYSPTRKRRHGNSPSLAQPSQLVICAQNHDQVGNRWNGERLSQLTSFEGLKLAAAAVLLSPYTPLLFMHEEFGETQPFLFFVNHSTAELLEQVRQGRREEFASFNQNGDPAEPHLEDTFSRCIRDCLDRGECSPLRDFYRSAIRLRKAILEATTGLRQDFRVLCHEQENTIVIEYLDPAPVFLVVLCFSKDPVEIPLPRFARSWHVLLDSTSGPWSSHSVPANGSSRTKSSRLSLAPRSALVFGREPFDVESVNESEIL